MKKILSAAFIALFALSVNSQLLLSSTEEVSEAPKNTDSEINVESEIEKAQEILGAIQKALEETTQEQAKNTQE